MVDIEFNFLAKLWRYDGPNAWYFVTLPKDVGDRIRAIRPQHKGFGSVRVTAKIGETSWKTSVFPDKKSESYLLPIKGDIRKKERLTVGDELATTLMVKL